LVSIRNLTFIIVSWHYFCITHWLNIVSGLCRNLIYWLKKHITHWYLLWNFANSFKVWNLKQKWGVRVVVFDATFTNISFISWLAVLLLGEIGENHRPAASHWQTLSFISLCVLVFKMNKKALEQREFLFCVHIIQKTEWMESLELKSECKKEMKLNILNYFMNRHNIIKLSELMTSKRKPILKKLCHFISAINTDVCPPGS